MHHVDGGGDASLRTHPFFDRSFALPLFGADGSQYAQQHRDRILADSLLALTLPVGANPVPRLVFPNDDRNFDMHTLYKNGWPSTRTSTEDLNWHHSDIREVAYSVTPLPGTNSAGHGKSLCHRADGRRSGVNAARQ